VGCDSSVSQPRSSRLVRFPDALFQGQSYSMRSWYRHSERPAPLGRSPRDDCLQLSGQRSPRSFRVTCLPDSAPELIKQEARQTANIERFSFALHRLSQRTPRFVVAGCTSTRNLSNNRLLCERGNSNRFPPRQSKLRTFSQVGHSMGNHFLISRMKRSPKTSLKYLYRIAL